MLLMIDNYDSFTFNLVQYFGELGEDVRVFRNDEITLDGRHRPERVEALIVGQDEHDIRPGRGSRSAHRGKECDADDEKRQQAMDPSAHFCHGIRPGRRFRAQGRGLR